MDVDEDMDKIPEIKNCACDPINHRLNLFIFPVVLDVPASRR
jgi:hypothetical protein